MLAKSGASGYTLWSHAFDRDVSAVFQTQGEIATEVARAHGVEAMFTLSGAHVFPLYDAAVIADPQTVACRMAGRPGARL